MQERVCLRTSPECQASYRSVGGWYSNRGFGAIKAMRRFRGTAAKPHRCTLIPPQPNHIIPVIRACFMRSRMIIAA